MPTRRAFYTVAITFLALHAAFFLPVAAMAQQPSPYQKQEGQVQQTTPSVIKSAGEGNQYYLGQANELLMRVNVWGRVLKPGQYFVPATTDLITLISAAGGPEGRSRLTDVKVVRGGTGSTSEVIEVNLKKYLKTGDKRLIPSLKPEDTVIVNGSAWQLFTEIMTVSSGLALLANVYFLFFIARR
ncbi:MAG TPA: hypothetical protein VGL38_14575 [bacterium]|jgi:hypothetical protein